MGARRLNPNDYIGKKYGHFVIQKYIGLKNNHRYYECKCDCGRTKTCILSNLKSGKSKSCGCSNHERYIKENYYIIEDDYVIGLTTNTNKKFYIDKEDFDRIKHFCWREDNYGYIVTQSKRKTIKLHRYIMQPDCIYAIDHINHNVKDNRKRNLRICTTQQNNFNTVISKNNTSGFKGVFWNKEKKKWNARIMINYKNIHLGYFDDIEEAEKVRKDAELKYFGEYANL